MSWHRADIRQRMSLQHSDRKPEVLHCVGRKRRESVCDTRLLGKPSDFSGAQDACRDWSTVFKGYVGAAIARLKKLMDNAAKATEPTSNADDRAASAQLHWMMLMICKGETLNTGDNRSLATTDREVRAEDGNSVRKAIDVHPVLLIPR